MSDEVNRYLTYRNLVYPEYILVLVVLIGLSVWYFITEKKNGEFKPHYPLIILLSVLFVISVVSITIFPSELQLDIPVFNRILTEHGYSITELDYYKHAYIYVSTELKFQCIIISFAVLYMVYLLLWVVPRKVRYIRYLDIFMYVIITLSVIAIIFSLCTEIDQYQAFFEALQEPNKPFPASLNSFVGNKNSFGMLLAFAIFACLYLHHTHGHWWFLVAPIIFLVELIFVSSKTNVMISCIVLFIYFATWLVFRFKKKLISSLIVLGVVLTLLITGIVLFVVNAVNHEFMTETFGSIYKMVDYFVVTVFKNPDQYSGRDRQYSRALILLNSENWYWAIGLGFGLFNYVFNGMENLSTIPNLYTFDSSTIYSVDAKEVVTTDSPHSSYYQLVGCGGYVTLVIYAILVLYLVAVMVALFKKYKKTVILCASFLIASIIHSFPESPTLFFMSPVYADSLVFTLFVAIPILSLYHHEKHPSENKKFLVDFEQNREKLLVYNHSSLVAKSVYFFLTPIMVILCVLAPMCWTPNFDDHLGLVIAMFVMIGIYVIVPVVLQPIFDKKTKFTLFLRDVVAPYYVELIIFSGFIVLYKLAFAYMSVGLAALFLVFCFVAHIALFRISSFYFERAGVVTLLMDKLALLVNKADKKNIVISEEKDSYTLQEKFFRLITPKRFKENETANN